MFSDNAPSANAVFFRTYSRRTESGNRESWSEVCDRTTKGTSKIGKLTPEETKLIDKYQREFKTLSSGRWLWVGGTEWIKNPLNVYGGYNCSGSDIVDFKVFGLLMNLTMQGCGTGAVLEEEYINQLPQIRNKINVNIKQEIGVIEPHLREEETEIIYYEGDSSIDIVVGDSRKAWVDAYQSFLEISVREELPQEITVNIYLGSVRNSGEKLKGFGGTANPVKLRDLWGKLAKILNKAIGRKLLPKECCLLLDEMSVLVVAGNIRRGANMRQFDSSSDLLKVNLWQQDETGKWKVDPERDAYRMGNHTRVYHEKPSRDECIDAVKSQYYSGEGAIQWAGEAIARSNADLLMCYERKKQFLEYYEDDISLAKNYLAALYFLNGATPIDDKELEHRITRYSTNPCLRGDMKILTKDGYKTFESLDGQNVEIINANGDICLSRIWCSGEKNVLQIKLGGKKNIFCTPDHSFMNSNGQRIFASNLRKGDRLMPFLKTPIHSKKYSILGFIQGDGQLSDLTNNQKGQLGVYINIGKRDQDIVYLLDQMDGVEYRWHGDRKVYVNGFNNEIHAMNFSLSVVPDRILPSSYSEWDLSAKASFLSGLYSANGSVLSNGRITFKTTCNLLAEQIVDSLKDDFGISAYVTINKSKAVKFSNGVYQCRESYDINILQYCSRLTFFNQINFIQSYKVDKLARLMIDDSLPVTSIQDQGVFKVYDFSEPITHWGVVEGFITHNCGEIVSKNFMCNLSEVHLNNINPLDFKEQQKAFEAGALNVAALLHQKFPDERYQYSREIDPIVAVCPTGLFDFFVKLFGVDWLYWWESGRPRDWEVDNVQYKKFGAIADQLGIDKKTIEWEGDEFGVVYKRLEQEFFSLWSKIVHEKVWEYCDRHNLKKPNRCTSVQPSGTKSLLTGASPGWHPPKAQRFIRRITFGKNDPVALACIDYGYNVIPSQSDKDENGNLLNDPYSPLCTEWLVEIPTEVHWANLPGADQVDISKFSALAQFDFYMQVQKYYTKHNSSGTLEIREHEIKEVGERIYQAIQEDEGYISIALLARFDDKETYPRLPFEPIDKETYERLYQEVKARQKTDDFCEAMAHYDLGEIDQVGPAGCDSDKCMFPVEKL